ncbi:MAG: hypothetical protein E7467_07450 [Ruminococcaceae bacterium]|nr:hypothetical protein [Oscillospiraceae bacterium]
MSRRKGIWIIVAAAVLLAAILALIWQWDSVGEGLDRLNYGQEVSIRTTAGQEMENKPSVQPSVSEETPTQTSSEPMQTEPTETTQPTETTEPSVPETEPTTLPPLTVPPTEETDPALQEKLDRIEELVDSVYSLRDEYISRLKQIEQDGIARYNALPEEEQTEERKQAIAFECVDAAYALEKECDARIDTICAELGYLLIQTGNDQSLVSEIRYVYAVEKANAKSELMERYGALLS